MESSRIDEIKLERQRLQRQTEDLMKKLHETEDTDPINVEIDEILIRLDRLLKELNLEVLIHRKNTIDADKYDDMDKFQEIMEKLDEEIQKAERELLPLSSLEPQTKKQATALVVVPFETIKPNLEQFLRENRTIILPDDIRYHRRLSKQEEEYIVIDVDTYKHPGDPTKQELEMFVGFGVFERVKSKQSAHGYYRRKLSSTLHAKLVEEKNRRTKEIVWLKKFAENQQKKEEMEKRIPQLTLLLENTTNYEELNSALKQAKKKLKIYDKIITRDTERYNQILKNASQNSSLFVLE
jgi:hypothetical protein